MRCRHRLTGARLLFALTVAVLLASMVLGLLPGPP